MIGEQESTEEELEKALRSIAILIRDYGPKYWPVFERIERELELVQARQLRLAAALKN